MTKRITMAVASALGVAIALVQPAVAAAASNGNGSAPAGGAAIGQVIGATLAAMIITGVMLVLVAGHRSGRVQVIGRLAAFSERVSGIAGFASLPSAIQGSSLIIAFIGMYWDISIHIDEGRDPGPLANPAHYFILVGLFGVFFAGVLACSIPKEKPGPTSVRLPNGWQVPLGGLLITLCGAVALGAFPLDDIWHRLFGQDVTLWGPTHLLLIGGASFSVVGLWILVIEGQQARGAERVRSPIGRFREVSLAGAFLIGLSTFQAEFDFGVPQFRLVCQTLLIIVAAGVGLVAARTRLGKGGALMAVGFYVALRGLMSLLVGPIIGNTTPHFPLYVVEAGLVELVALRLGGRKPIQLGLWSGVAIGTVGLAAEWAWTHVWFDNPWPSSAFPEAAIVGFLGAIAGGVLGGLVGRAMIVQEEPERVPRWLFPAAASMVVALLAWSIPAPNPSKMPHAQVALTPIDSGPHRTVQVTAKLDPPDAAKDARWFNATAWQGGGEVVNRMKKIGDGLYRTTKPIPVWGNWKVTLRIQKGASVMGMALYFPSDPAIPAAGIPATPTFTRPFVRDKKLLQREQKPGTSAALWGIAYVVVGAIWFAMLAAIAWGLARIGSRRSGRRKPPVARREAPAPAGGRVRTA
ncbi:MAG: hypothetical protein ACJ768_21755 [Gaiellaceae bacterium]